MADLPRWQARNDRDRREMHEWVCAKLDDWLSLWRNREQIKIDNILWRAETENYGGKGYSNQAVDEILRGIELGFAFEEAQQGNVERLRELYPDIADYIHPRKLTPGQKPLKPPKRDAVADAVAASKYIRHFLWPKFYGKKYRRSAHGPSADEIAAAYCGVTVDDIVRRRHKSGPPSRQNQNKQAHKSRDK